MSRIIIHNIERMPELIEYLNENEYSFTEIQMNNMERKSWDFIRNLKRRRKRIDLYTINELSWFNGAWGTINESLRNLGGYGYLNEGNNKFSIALSVYGLLNDFPYRREEIDMWYRNSIELISDDQLMTIGRSQKIINILIKYYITHYYAFGGVNERIMRFSRTINQIHIPIDRVVLRALRQNFLDDFNGIINPALQIVNGDGEAWSWSNLTDINLYFELQDLIRQKSQELNFNSPLEFEMTELWVA